MIMKFSPVHCIFEEGQGSVLDNGLYVFFIVVTNGKFMQ